jgi:hypothetical protein
MSRPLTPEEAAVLEEWIDKPLPVLDGKTRKQAAQSEEGRKQLQEVLQASSAPSMEHVEEIASRLG